MGIDLFADALGDDWSSGDDAAKCPGEPASSAVGEDRVPKKRGRPPGAFSKRSAQNHKNVQIKRKERKQPPSSELRQVTPPNDAKDNNLYTVFVNTVACAKSGRSKGCVYGDKKLPKRLNPVPGGVTPVPIWPVYEVSLLKGTWAVINPYTEAWLENMLHLCRPGGNASSSASIKRQLIKRCRQAVMVMLHKALKSNANAKLDSEDLDGDDVDAADVRNGLRRCLSGFEFRSFPVLRVNQGSSDILQDYVFRPPDVKLI